MGLSKFKLGDLIEQTDIRNSELRYGVDDVKGMTISKTIIPTKADVEQTDLSKFKIVHPHEFIYNPRTHGKKIGLGYNDTNGSFLISWNNIAFRIKEDANNKVIPSYLYMHFNRLEWDREATYKSWGSSTEVFSWEALCSMEYEFPEIKIQQKYVDTYKAMLVNQRLYESGLDDLKLVCDGYAEDLRRKIPLSVLETYIKRVDQRNGKHGSKNVMGVSTTKEYRKPTSKVNKENLENYKVVKPRQISFVQTTHNEKVFCNAFNSTNQNIIVTSVNEVIECDENFLLPEFLVMFFNRTEFDRYARFHSWGSARETFTWNDLIKVKLPIPNIIIQKSIVNIFTAYKTRKDINEKLKSQIKNICPILIKGAIEEAKL